jgi:hypothetical protein
MRDTSLKSVSPLSQLPPLLFSPKHNKTKQDGKIASTLFLAQEANIMEFFDTWVAVWTTFGSLAVILLTVAEVWSYILRSRAPDPVPGLLEVIRDLTEIRDEQRGFRNDCETASTPWRLAFGVPKRLRRLASKSSWRHWRPTAVLSRRVRRHWPRPSGIGWSGSRKNCAD